MAVIISIAAVVFLASGIWSFYWDFRLRRAEAKLAKENQRAMEIDALRQIENDISPEEVLYRLEEIRKKYLA